MSTDLVNSSSAPTNPTKKYRLVILVLIVIDILLLSFILIKNVQMHNAEAQKLDAEVDWKAVSKGENPIYIIKYRVVRIEYSDIPAVEKTIEDLHLQVDIWNDEGGGRSFLFGGATDTAIRTLQERGYTVKILYNSYKEYLKAMEEQQ
jgi:hypothetical protein